MSSEIYMVYIFYLCKERFVRMAFLEQVKAYLFMYSRRIEK